MMAPALLLFLNASDFWVYAGAALAGFFVLATLPIGVVMAYAGLLEEEGVEFRENGALDLETYRWWPEKE